MAPHAITLTERFDLAAAKVLANSSAVREEERAGLSSLIAASAASAVRVSYTVPGSGVGRLRIKAHGRGRAFVPCAAQGLSSGVRSHLAHRLYHDIDIANCHPVLMLQFLRRQGLPVAHLEHYVTNRAEVLRSIEGGCSVDRSAAKDLMLRVSYGGKIAPWCEDTGVGLEDVPPFVNSYSLELRANGLEVVTRNPKALEHARRVCEDKGDDPWGGAGLNARAFAHYTQTEERKCLLALYEFLTSRGRAVGALIHDGLHVERDAGAPAGAPVGDELLRAAERHIEAVAGYAVRLAEKPMDPDPALLGDGEDGDEYAAAKAEFELTHAKIQLPPMFLAGSTFLTRADLSVAYENMRVMRYIEGARSGGALKEAGFVDVWCKDPDMRSYERADFLPPPLACPESVYNLWSGFAAEALPPSGLSYDELVDDPDVGLFLEHVLNLVGRDGASCNYMVRWIAHIFQRPGELPRTAVVVKSEQGAGKNTLTDLVKALVGGRKGDLCFETTNAARDLFGRFTEAFNHKLLVVLNEASGAANKQFDGVLKGLISDTSVVYEAKGKAPLEMTNCARVLLFSNRDFIVPIEHSDRRYVVFESASDHIRDTEYFNRLHAAFGSAAVQRKLYEFLTGMDLSSLDLARDRPLTQVYSDMKEVPLIVQWLLEYATVALKQGADVAKLANAHATFSLWCARNSINSTYSTVSLGRKISLMGIGGVGESKHTKRGNVREVDVHALAAWLVREGYWPKSDFADVMGVRTKQGFSPTGEAGRVLREDDSSFDASGL